MNESVESEKNRAHAAPQRPSPARATLRPPRASSNSRLPFWLVMLGLAMVLGAFSRGENDAGSTRRTDRLAFDLDGLPATGSGGYTASRPSMRAYAVMGADEGRFYAPYGPAGVADAATALAGVLVGQRSANGGSPSDAATGSAAPAHADAVYEFSLESGALRVTRQDGPFDPARFVAAGAAVRPSAAVVPVADPAAGASRLGGRYDGRLSDAVGSRPADVRLGANGELVIAAEDGCRLRGSVVERSGETRTAVRPVEAVFGSGCARVGEVLQGHVFSLPASNGDGHSLVVVLADAGLADGLLFAGHRR